MKPDQAHEFFAAPDAKPVASTANEKDGTIDVVWYTGAQVPRKDPDTGEPYMLTLDMDGARLDRLNAGAPIFDTHFTGDDYKSVAAGKAGTKAQVGVVNKAWADGPNGMATLQVRSGRRGRRGVVPQGVHRDRAEPELRSVDLQPRENQSTGPDRGHAGRQAALQQPERDRHVHGDRLGTVRDFGCSGPRRFQHNVLGRRRFSTQAAAAKQHGQSSPQKEKPAMAESTTQTAGAEARVNEQALVAARGEAVKLERERIVEIDIALLASNRFSEMTLSAKPSPMANGRSVQRRRIRGAQRQGTANRGRRGKADSE